MKEFEKACADSFRQIQKNASVCKVAFMIFMRFLNVIATTDVETDTDHARDAMVVKLDGQTQAAIDRNHSVMHRRPVHTSDIHGMVSTDSDSETSTCVTSKNLHVNSGMRGDWLCARVKEEHVSVCFDAFLAQNSRIQRDRDGLDAKHFMLCIGEIFVIFSCQFVVLFLILRNCATSEGMRMR
jgi:hypothetical protein